jgi:hypothetical protein
MSRARNLPTGDGYSIVECPMCNFSPLRDDGTEVRSKYNWLSTCTACRERGCRECIPESGTVCLSCAQARVSDPAPDEFSPALADAPLFGGALRGDEPLPPAPEAFATPEEDTND